MWLKLCVDDSSDEADARMERKLKVIQWKHWQSFNQSVSKPSWALTGRKQPQFWAAFEEATLLRVLCKLKVTNVINSGPDFYSLCALMDLVLSPWYDLTIDWALNTMAALKVKSGEKKNLLSVLQGIKPSIFQSWAQRSTSQLYPHRAEYSSTPLLPQQHVKDQGHSAESAGGRLQLNTHSRIDEVRVGQLSCPGIAMGTHQGN